MNDFCFTHQFDSDGHADVATLVGQLAGIDAGLVFIDQLESERGGSFTDGVHGFLGLPDGFALESPFGLWRREPVEWDLDDGVLSATDPHFGVHLVDGDTGRHFGHLDRQHGHRLHGLQDASVLGTVPDGGFGDGQRPGTAVSDDCQSLIRHQIIRQHAQSEKEMTYV